VTIVNFYQRHDKIRVEARLAWNWLIKQPKYWADYTRQKKLKEKLSSEEQEKLRKKYGFFPLIDPKTKMPYSHAPQGFFIAFGKLLGQLPFDSGVIFETLDYIELDAYQHPKKYKKYKYKPYSLPKQLSITIDPKKPINFILNQIENYLRRIKKIYKIKYEHPPVVNLNLAYKYYVLENWGVKRKEIRREIAPFAKDKTDESQRKKAYKISKKVKSIRSRKL